MPPLSRPDPSGINASFSESSSSSAGSNDNNQFYVASALVDSGVNHHSLGEYDKALKAFHTALKTQRLTLGNDHVCVAHTLGNIGAVYLKLGKLTEATEALEQSLNIKMRLRQRASGANGTAIVLADTLNNLGSASYLRGLFDVSMSYYRRSLDESYSVGPDERDNTVLADTLHNMGRIHLQRHELDSAFATLTESLRVTKQMHGPDHINVADTLELIGSVHLRRNETDEAMEIFQEVARITRTVLGPTHPDLASSCFNVGMTHEARGELHKAWESYQAALEIYKRAGLENGWMGSPEPHIGVTTVRRSMAKVEKMIQHEAAVQRHEKTEENPLVSVKMNKGRIQLRC